MLAGETAAPEDHVPLDVHGRSDPKYDPVDRLRQPEGDDLLGGPARSVALTHQAIRAGLQPPAEGELDGDGWLDLVAGELVYPAQGLGGLTFIYDYPASQAALAQVRSGEPPVAERFEAFLDGMELANGFHELGDGGEQRRRFTADLTYRREQGLMDMPMDERLLAALEHGFPDCAGVAIGFDRLVMIAASARSLDEVIAFPADRA